MFRRETGHSHFFALIQFFIGYKKKIIRNKHE